MILTDREIQIAISQKQVTIDPAPARDAYASTSVDLTLGRRFAVWQTQTGAVLRPGTPGFEYNDFVKNQRVEDKESHVLNARDFVLAWTQEVVALPVHSRVAARVEGKSSLARLGIGVHITAPTIHCGFSGAIQLEIVNHGPHQVMLDVGMRICQLIFELTAGTPEKGYQGLFLNQAPTP